MGKQGPCYHCGITTTPLWRNGPPEKPILCNACGSRWRTKGTLLNYMPMHSGGFGVGPENARWPMKSSARLTLAPPADKTPSRKRKLSPNSDSGLSKTSNTYLSSSVDEDASTLGSEVSTFDVSVRGTPWDTPVPCRRRSSMFRSRGRKLVSMEEQEVSSVTCPSSDLLLETRSPLVAVEAGLGSVFIRPRAPEPESEATSLLIDNCSRVYEAPEVLLGRRDAVPGLYGNRLGASAVPSGGKEIRRRAEAGRSKSLLEHFPYNKRDVLQSVKSPLVLLELKDVVNYETFAGLLTEQEQRHLMKHLASVDLTQFPESVKSLFRSLQFERALENFQELLSRGMFDSSEAGFDTRLVQHYQQLLSVTDLTASGWMESLSQFQTRGKRRPEASLKLKPDPGGASPPPPAERKPGSVLEAHRAGSSLPGDESSSKVKRVVNLMEEGHDSGGEEEEEEEEVLLVELPSFQRPDSLLLHGGSSNSTMTNRGNNLGGAVAEAGDLIITNNWQTADWDVGLIGVRR